MYQGNSDSFRDLQRDYFSYSAGVNIGRALPDVRDGLKPVHRRILWSMRNLKGTVKSTAVVGDTLKIHPHGDSSVYGALVLMTDSRESWNVPLVKGQGTFGKVYSTLDAADHRYTEVAKNPRTADMLGDLDYVPYKPVESGEGTEPEVLPSRYPFMLTVGHEGIGVGVATTMAPYNFWDVLNLTYYYLQNKSFDNQYIFPDFPTGGNLYADPRTALTTMYTGKGTYDIRAGYSVDAGRIYISDVPYGQTAESIEAKILALKERYPDIKSVHNAVSLKGCGIDIVTTKGTESAVEALLFKQGILQTKFSSHMVWVNGSELCEGGVYAVIEQWANFRRSVVKKRLDSELTSARSELERLSYFITLVEDTPARDTYLDRVVNGSSVEASRFLEGYFSTHATLPQIPAEVVDWIYQRRAASFNKVNVHKTRYDNLQGIIASLEDNLQDIDKVILNDLEELADECDGLYPRRTELSTLKVSATRVNKKTPKVVAEDKPCRYAWNIQQGTITKELSDSPKSPHLQYFPGYSESTLLLALCVNGDLIKVWGSNLPLGQPVKLTSYADTNSLPFAVYSPDDPEQLFIFADGSLGRFTPSSFKSTRKFRKVTRAFPAFYDLVAIKPMDSVESVTWAYLDRIGQTVVMTDQLSQVRWAKNTSTRTRTHNLLVAEATHYGVNIDPKHTDARVLMDTEVDENPKWGNLDEILN